MKNQSCKFAFNGSQNARTDALQSRWNYHGSWQQIILRGDGFEGSVSRRIGARDILPTILQNRKEQITANLNGTVTTPRQVSQDSPGGKVKSRSLQLSMAMHMVADSRSH
jgi:hypothetical protein